MGGGGRLVRVDQETKQRTSEPARKQTAKETRSVKPQKTNIDRQIHRKAVKIKDISPSLLHRLRDTIPAEIPPGASCVVFVTLIYKSQ